MITTRSLEVQTRGQGDTRDITPEVATAVKTSGCASGIVAAFVVGSTAALTTIEYEPGAVADFDALLTRLAPRDAPYRHHERWGDDNGSSHVRAALLGPSLVVPFKEGRLALGTWQQIVVVECDTRGRSREIVLQIIGE